MTSKRSAPETSSASYGQVEVRRKWEWYRDLSKWSLFTALLALVGLVISLGLNYVQWTHRESPGYFAVTPDWRMIELKPLHEPQITQAGLLEWTKRAVVETFSLNFTNWRKALMEVRPRFSKDAYLGLLDALKSSGNLEAIQKRKLNVSVVVSRAPVITAEAVLQGRLSWKIEFPLKLTYENSDGVVDTQSLMATVLVQRVPVTRTFPEGLTIKKLLTKGFTAPG